MLLFDIARFGRDKPGGYSGTFHILVYSRPPPLHRYPTVTWVTAFSEQSSSIYHCSPAKHLVTMTTEMQSGSKSDGASRLWYKRQAALWSEALPIGNGRVGAMIFGNPWRERLQLNECTMYTGGPYTPSDPSMIESLPELRQMLFDGKYDEANELATGHFMAKPPRQAIFQPIGDMYIELPEVNGYKGEPGYHRELDLDSAMATVKHQVWGTHFTRRFVACPSKNVIAISLTADKPELTFNVHASSPQPSSSLSVDGDTLVMAGKNGSRDGVSGALTFEARFQVQTDGTVEQKGDHISVKGASSALILVAIATNYKSQTDLSGNPSSIAKGLLDGCKGQSFDQIASLTAEEHRKIYRRVSLNLPDTPQSKLPTFERIQAAASGDGKDDPSLAALYFNYGRYLLLSCSRPGGQPANLQGIWNDSMDPPWESKYTININIEMNYWSAETAAMPETLEPLVRMVTEMAETGAVTAKNMYGAKGWVAHHNTDFWRATAPIDMPQYGLWPLGGAWLLEHLWDHYDYGRDLSFLEQVYPVMKGACEFFLDTLIEHPTSGYLVTNPSMSPENVHGLNGSKSALSVDPTMDNQLLRSLFDHTIQAAKLLSRDQQLCSQLEATAARLRPTEIGKDGRIQEWNEYVEHDPEPEHRHTSHLFGVFPGHEITMEDTPDLAKAAKSVLLVRGEPGTGWATAWRINLWAHLQESELAYELVHDLICKWTMPNMFDLHPPLGFVGNPVFQIDGNLGGVSGMVEMLVQSRPNGNIVLLPALPSAWPTGSLKGIRLRGDWTVDVEWKDGALEKVTIHANRKDEREVMCGKQRQKVALDARQSVVLDHRLTKVSS